MRLLVTIVCSLIGVLLIGLALRFWGLTQPNQYFEAKYFKSDKIDIIAMGGALEEISYSWESFQEAYRKNFILGADVFITLDKKLVLMKPEAAYTYGGEKYVRFVNYSDLKESPIQLKELVDLYKESHLDQDSRFYFELHDNVNDIHEVFVASLEGHVLEDQILIRSPYDLISQAIKSLKPLWLYGSGHGERTRFLTLKGLYLEPLMNFFSDVYVTPIYWRNSKVATESLLSELERRNRRVVIGPIDSQEDFEEVKDYEADAFITHRPLWLSEQL